MTTYTPKTKPRRFLLQLSADIVAPFVTPTEPARFIFLVSWMRSGSTLLSNLILEAPQVYGIGETHTRWSRTNAALDYRLCNYAVQKTPPEGAQFLFDKVLHNHLDKGMCSDFLHSSRFIFLVRELNASLSSISRMRDSGFAASDFPIELYLRDRLKRLYDLSHEIPSANRYLITYNDLILNTGQLDQLSASLGFAIPQNFSVRRHTGTATIGDYSEKVKSGKIDGTPDIDDRAALAVTTNRLLADALDWKWQLLNEFR